MISSDSRQNVHLHYIDVHCTCSIYFHFDRHTYTGTFYTKMGLVDFIL